MIPTRGRVRGGGAAALLLALIVAACGSGSTPTAAPTSAAPTDTATPSDSTAPSVAATPVVPQSPVAGVVVAVDSQGLDQVKGFTLRTSTGDTIAFTLGQLDNPEDFPPGHLKEHQASAAPIFVFFHEQNGQLVVYHIEDAP